MVTRYKAWLLAPIVLATGLMASPSHSAELTLEGVAQAEHRTPIYAQRDAARHPVKTLAFFDVQPQHTVVEIWPGGGWYSELLAPYLSQEGHFYAAHFPAQTPVAYFKRVQAAYVEKLAQTPEVYGAVEVTEFHPPSKAQAAPLGEIDRVLTFRNVHNWLKAGYAPAAFANFYGLLNAGGVLGVVEHRAPAGISEAEMIRSGYVTEAKVIALATAAGFKLQASSDINANPRDTAQHPAGVWSLPPTLRLGATDREKYLAIGESDRMTLKFIKP